MEGSCPPHFTFGGGSAEPPYFTFGGAESPPSPPGSAASEAPSAGGFREEVKNVKIWFSSQNYMTNVGGTTNT